MPVSPTYPGVYVQEVPSGVRTIVGVGTSTALFVGRTQTGPMFRAVRVTTYSDFVRTFGDDGGASSAVARYVRLFFLNGGTDCYVIRIANGASKSSVKLQTATGAEALTLTAKNAGALGDFIRVAVDYDTATPEATFNLTIFRWSIAPGGAKTAMDQERFLNLSMDKNSPNWVVDQLNQKSKLVDATAPVIATNAGLSLSTRPLKTAAAADIINAPKQFQISLNGSAPLPVTVGVVAGASVAAARTAWATAIQNAIDAATTTLVGLPTPRSKVDVLDGVGAADATAVVRISSPAGNNYDVRVTSAVTGDLAAAIGLGTTNNGIEVGAFANVRPAPTGVSFLATADLGLTPFGATTNWVAFANTVRDTFTSFTLDEYDATGTLVAKAFDPALTSPTRIYEEAAGTTAGVLEVLGKLRDQVNSYQAANPTTFFWTATLTGHRLVFTNTTGDDNSIVLPPGFATVPPAIASKFLSNVRYYSLGPSGTAGKQVPGAAGNDGTAPHASDYTAAYEIAKRDIDLFNMLVLPPDAAPDVSATLPKLWGEASAVCREERAFLIMDPPDTWLDSQSAASGVNALRPGLTKDYSAVYFPKLRLVENGREVVVGPAGAVAGLYARTDANRGVWKAPAGSEADLRGVSGVDINMSDRQNGQINPVGVNAIRLFPEGVISWGARTMDGADAFASEYKYVPIRRLSLFIEESLYRGLKWAVFEANDEPLWAQIRLNVGAFMHDLFRKGAFQGVKPSDAYFVKCDRETTTANDQNLGIVNIWVGFAPLKPAEFVVLYLQQIAQQPTT